MGATFHFSLSQNFFEETAIAMGDYEDVKIILSDDPIRPEYRLHKVILAAQSSFFRKLFYHEPKEVGIRDWRCVQDRV